MKINETIRCKRKELGYTQEQIADRLGVSVPAVSKWESGSSVPDVALLAPLSRLLEIDVNTLLGFQEGLSDQEIACFVNQMVETIQKEGILSGFSMAEKKVQEYPNCSALLRQIALCMDGALIMSELTPEEKSEKEMEILHWYEQVARDGEEEVRNSANFMLASKYMQRQELEKVQETLDRLPQYSALDKRTLQAELYLKKKKPEQSAELMERCLLQKLTELQGILLRLMQSELEAGEQEKAEQIADIEEKMAVLFDMWKYNSYVAPLDLAIRQKNVKHSIKQLQGILAAIFMPWDLKASPLYHRISSGYAEAMKKGNPQILAPLLTELECSPQYDFLREEPEFGELLKQYRGRK